MKMSNRSYFESLRYIKSKEQESDITQIVTDYSTSNNIDMVINNSEVIYFSPSVDITEYIIDIVKEKNLYTDELLNQKESVN